MKVNIIELKKLLQDEFDGNQKAFSKDLGVDRTHLNKILKNNGSGAGGRFCGAIMQYCIDNNMDFQRFIFLDKNVNKNRKKVNRKESEQK